MAASGFPSERLSDMRLRQLRGLASRLGIARYSRMLKQQLVLAIESRASMNVEIGDPRSAAVPLASIKIGRAHV